MGPISELRGFLQQQLLMAAAASGRHALCSTQWAKETGKFRKQLDARWLLGGFEGNLVSPGTVATKGGGVWVMRQE